MKPEVDPNHIVIFSGAGISAESGIKTYTDSDGLWHNHRIESVATLSAFNSNPEFVTNFYNERKREIVAAQPNAAHIAIGELESKYKVTVITQNVDDLHDRVSSNVIHVHGCLTQARHRETGEVYNIGNRDFTTENMERPHVVFYNEVPENLDIARQAIKTAGKVLIVGTSLNVKPACNLVKHARGRAEKILITKDIAKRPFGFEFIRGNASELVPLVCRRWLR